MKKRILIFAALLLVALFASSIFYYYHQSPLVITSYSAVRQYRFIREYSLPPDSFPNAIALDAQGNVWFTMWKNASLAELTPATGILREFPLPISRNEGMTSWGIAVDSSRGFVWFTDAVSDSVWRFNIANSEFQRFQLAKQAFPFQVAVDKNGDAWFTEFSANKLGEISPSGILHQWSISNSTFPEPAGIAIDQQTGTVWFTLSETQDVGSFSNGKFTIYNLRNETITSIVGIAIDPQGNLWLTQHYSSLISEFNPSTHYFRSISTSIPPLQESLPYFLQVDQSGMVWLDEHYGNAISLFNPTTNQMIEYKIPSEVESEGNVSGALTLGLSDQGVPWFTEAYSSRIGTVNVSIPLTLSLNLNPAADLTLGARNGSSIVLPFSVQGIGESFAMSSALANSSGNLNVEFSESSGDGNLSAHLTVKNEGSPTGLYFLTISTATSDVIVSQVLALKVN